MLRLKPILTALLLSTFAFAGAAFACSPHFNQMSDYARNRIPDGVVFVGKVQSVVEQRNGNIVTMNIEFRATRWLEGSTKKTVLVRGMIGSYSGTNCSGQFDFRAKKGEEWLIFGQIYKGKVNPDVSLSRKLVRGKIPAPVLRELRLRPNQ